MNWAVIEQKAKIISLLAIPVVLAVGGWLIQDSLAKRSVSQEYVKLAVSILKESKEKVDSSLRDWAVDLLNENSPTKFSKITVERLKAGQANLPVQIAALLSQSGGGASLAVSPDGATVATGHTDGTVHLWNLQSGVMVMELRAHLDAVTALAFSPDGRMILTGSLDNTARLWEISTGRQIRVLGHTAGVIGVSISPDGKILLTRSLDRTWRKWSADNGMQIGAPISLPE